MYKVICELLDGSVFSETSATPCEVVARYFRSYGVEVCLVEVKLVV